MSAGVGSYSPPGGSSESRISVGDVPDQISRIFFGDPKPSYDSPSSSYAHPPVGGSGHYAGYGGGAVAPYPGYYDDVELLVKLGQAALIVFIIFAIVAIIFMLVLACLYCCYGGRGSSRQSVAPRSAPAPAADHHDAKGGYPKPDFSSFSSSTRSPSLDPPPLITTPVKTAKRKKTRGMLHDDNNDSDYDTDGRRHQNRPLHKRSGISNLNELTSASDVASVYNSDDARETVPKQKPSFILSDSGHAHTPRPPAPDPAPPPPPSSDVRRPRDLPPVPPPPAASPLPKPPSSMTSSSNSSSKRYRRSRSHASDDTASQPRSVPYYEVPAPRAYSIREAEHVRGESHIPSSSHTSSSTSSSTPPPRPPISSSGSGVVHATQTTSTSATSAPMSASVRARNPPFSYIEQETTSSSRKVSSMSTHSRLV